jgi:glyoxylase-like metal-dependent hydrolase (beta-lactamase superfamily II)
VVSDGYTKLDAGAIHGLVPRVMWEPIVGPENIDSEHRMKLALNCAVIRTGGATVLVDTGMGDKHGPQVRERQFPGDYGYLLAGLARIGLAPADITHVVNTHLHADHCGWNTVRRDADLKPTFPRARYVCAASEYDDATHPNERTRGTYFAENFTPLAQAGVLELVSGEHTVVAGVTFIPAPGHTAGHGVVALTSGGETALFTGDLAHSATQFERLAWLPAFDVLPMVSIETKRVLTARAVAERALIVSVHNPFPGAGRLVERDGRRVFVAE